MNRATPQNDDLRRMQQEAMRRVQEMQNRSQSYVRSGGISPADERSMPAKSNDSNDGSRYNQSRSSAQRSRQQSRPPLPVQNTEPVQQEAGCDDNIPQEPECVECLSSVSSAVGDDNCKDGSCPCCNTCPKQNGNGNDMAIILLILLLAGNNGKNDSILLAALIFLLI